MKLFGLIGSFTSLLIFQGCLNTQETTCNRENDLLQNEFFIEEISGEYYLSQSEGSDAVFLMCEQVLPPDTIGVEGIVAINGTYIDKCSDGVCITVDEYLDPFCVVEYETAREKVELIGTWRLAYKSIGSRVIHPSCNYSNIQFEMEEEDGPNGDLLLQGSLGVNTLSVVFQSSADSVLSISSALIDTEQTVPYVTYFERQVAEMYRFKEVIGYSISGNELTFYQEGGTTLRFYRP